MKFFFYNFTILKLILYVYLLDNDLIKLINLINLISFIIDL